jgi:hypothetical protein
LLGSVGDNVKSRRRLPGSFFVAVLATVAGCVAVQPATDTGDLNPASPTSPASPTNTPTNPTGPANPTNPTTPAALAYDPDMKAIFASDCVSCHGGSRVYGNYRMTTYSQVMAAVRPGSATSPLILVTQPSGSMYRYWSGNTTTRQAKAAQVRDWIVTYNAQATR